MKPVRVFNVTPALPAPLERLRDLAYNMRWAWNHDTIELFRRLDSDLWETVWHNPVLMLGSLEQERLEAAARDESVLAHLDRAHADLTAYLAAGRSWFQRNYGKAEAPSIAYFSAEFGLTECLSIFAGGLGILAGDHMKSASDLGVPLIGVGLLYQQGYFRQYLNPAGWQQEDTTENDFVNLPVRLERRPDGSPVKITVRYPGNPVVAQVWKAQAGRVSLYLLDTNIPDNVRPQDRDITDQLYGGDLEMRMKQEILLGIGGYRALQALGIEPTVFHMNEGHSAFLALERVRCLMHSMGMSFTEACEVASSGLVFTTHTPVAAGHDYFPADLMNRYLSEYAQSMGLSAADLMALGRRNPADSSESFCMTVLALRLASYSNGVSKLHGKVSRGMWRNLWPGVPEDEVPVGHVTNGVHFRSWISHEMNQLYDRYLGPNWREEPGDAGLWQRVHSIPSEELWRSHERRRERLVAFARHKLAEQLRGRGAPQAEIDQAEEALDPEALTIGFARRFATYKRATLLMRDPERLVRILNDAKRPVQIIFAGKAHPRDDAGKDLIRQIVAMARRPDLRRRMVFIEDYDMAVARYLVQGADVWLNTPLRPLEASGTSGMKALANGVLNLSTLDGWWDEAWQMRNHGAEPFGWAIGNGETYADRNYQDQVEAEALYDLLERDVVPTFYERRADGVPRRWVERMKSSIGSLCHMFNTHRMVQEYTERFYLLAHARYRRLTASGAARARSVAQWKGRVHAAWPQVRVESIESGLPTEMQVGARIDVRAAVRLGPLEPADVEVGLYMGRLNADEEFLEAMSYPMQATGERRGDAWVFQAAATPCCRSGRHGFTVRVLPFHDDMGSPFPPGLITWAAQEATAATK